MSEVKSSLFRPSALSAATNEIWKKSATVASGSFNDNKEESAGNRFNSNVFSSSSGSNSKHDAPRLSEAGASSTRSGFVFGQNMQDRAIVDDNLATSKTDSSASAPVSFSEASAEVTIQNGKSNELLGPSPVPPQNDDVIASGSQIDNANSDIDNSEFGAHVLPPPDPASVVTGEENEINICHATCKLYILDKEKQSWTERGRGVLRINDSGNFAGKNKADYKSRLVMRTQGSLRVILNSKISASTVLERASEKSFRLTAFDFETGSLAVYLVTTNAKDSQYLEDCIRVRVDRLKDISASEESNQQGTTAPPRVPEKETKDKSQESKRKSALENEEKESVNNECSEAQNIKRQKTGNRQKPALGSE